MSVLVVVVLVGPPGALPGGGGLKPPTGLAVAAASDTSVTLAWSAGHGRPAASFAVSRDGNEVGSTAGQGYVVGGLVCGRAYSFAVQAVDAGGDRSDAASLVAATAPCPTAAPMPPPPSPPPAPPAPPPAPAPAPPAAGDGDARADASPTETPAPAPRPKAAPDAPSTSAGWQGAGAFVWHETHIAPEALAAELRDNGFSWVALLLHDGLVTDAIEGEWIERFRTAAPGLDVGGWGVLRIDPEREAELAGRLVARHGLDFYVANPEAEYKLTADDGQNAERFERSRRFVDAFRALEPVLPAAVSSYCRADRQDLDWRAWQQGGFAFLPQAYVNDFGSAASPAACAAGAAAFFGVDAVHPTLGMYPGEQGAPAAELYAELLADAGTVGFSVYLAEVEMSPHAWRTLGDAIDARGIARTSLRTASTSGLS